jgi:micrococcal nuclease
MLTGFLRTLALFVVLLPAVAAAAGLSTVVKVVWVMDGDTFMVVNEQGERRSVRINAIDAPEKGRKDMPGQPYAERSRQFLARLVEGERVHLLIVKEDDYGRIVARVWFDGQDVGLRQVCAGYAWAYEYYLGELAVKDQRDYRDCQARARREQRGLWRDERAIAPWDWRYRQRRLDERR